MPARIPTSARRVAAVGAATLALSMTGAPAFGLDAPLAPLDTVTEPVEQALAPVADPVVEALVSDGPSPSPEPENPVTGVLPEPVKSIVEPVVEQAEKVLPPNPVTGQGGSAQEVPAPGSGSAPTPAKPQPTTSSPAAAGTVAATSSGGTGSTSLGALGGAPRAGSGVAGSPLLAAPMVAAPTLALPGFAVPAAAPPVVDVVAAPRPGPASVPAGLPGLVVLVASVAVVVAGAAHLAELRTRRVAAAARG